MHQLAQLPLNGTHQHYTVTQTTIQASLIFANSLDCEVFAQALQDQSDKATRQRRVQIIATTSDLDFGLARCARQRPQFLLLDPKVATDATDRAIASLMQAEIQHLLIVDDRLHEGRLASLLKTDNVSYITRASGLKVLRQAIEEIDATDRRFFDACVATRIKRKGLQLRLEPAATKRSVLRLTPREREVMKLLASGHTVRQIAEILGLAQSTIDNHKSRLMKKLDIHKIVDLTHLAIREGLIVV